MKRLFTCLLLVFFAFPAFAEEAAKPAAAQPVDLFGFLDGDNIIGSRNAPLTVIEYASLSCSHCADFKKHTFPLIKQHYIDTGKVLFVYRHYPLNEPALRGAMVVDCNKDRAFTFLKVLFETQGSWAFSVDPKAELKRLAAVGGMNSKDFDACMANKALEDRILLGVKAASETLGIEATPTLFVGKEKVSGYRDYKDFSAILDKHLK